MTEPESKDCIKTSSPFSYSSWTSVMIVHFFVIFIVSSASGLGFPGDRNNNVPPIFQISRDWEIPENTPLGSRVITIRVRDEDGDNITYGLEPPVLDHFDDGSQFFSINSKSGDVFLKESFEGQGGKHYFLSVTAFDGHQISKMDVSIIISSAANKDDSVVSSNSNSMMGFRQPLLPAMIHPSRPKFPSNPWPSVPRPPPIPSFHPKSSTLNLPTALPIPSPRPTTSESTDVILPGGRVVHVGNNHIPTGHDGSNTSSEKIGDRRDWISAFIPLLAAMIISPIAGLVFFLMHRCHKEKKRAELIKSLSQKTPLHFESSISSSSSSGVSSSFSSGESRVDFFNHLKYNKRTTSLCNRYDGSDFISSPFSVRENGSDGWEFPRKNLLFSRILGEGNFGQVWMCDAIDLCGDQKRETVAVKMLKQIHTEKEKRDLLSELAIMKMLGPHPNVVSLLGCCSDQEPVYLIMEYLPNGKLQTYLRNCRSQAAYNSILTAQDLTSFAYQIAKGMEYISSKGIIHRDLAARNVLLSADKCCKIADFGFARDVMSCANQSYERKSEGPLPIRWMAPESLVDHVYTTKSDVWSFGVLLWEIVTLGWTPYPGMDPQSIARQVPQGYRMEKPDHCRRELFHIMHYCWHQCPEERLTFTQVKDMLGNMLESDTDYIQLDQFPDRNYYNVVTTAFQERI